MSAPGLLDGVVTALGISLAAAAASLLFGHFVTTGALFQAVLWGATLAYLVYLLRRSRARTGRIVVIGAWALATLGCWLLGASLSEQVLLYAGLIWLVRSLYFHGSIPAALLDLGLVAVGLAAALWALLNTGSMAASLWSFFLVQALFRWIPAFDRARGAAESRATASASSFQSAHRVALDAVRKLSQP